jgi:hypothetical protein
MAGRSFFVAMTDGDFTEDQKLQYYGLLQLAPDHMNLKAFAVSLNGGSMSIYLKFRYLRSVQQVVDLLQLPENCVVVVLGSKQEETSHCLKMTGSDPECLFFGLRTQEVAFVYELHNWVKTTPAFHPLDPFVVRHCEKFSFLAAYHESFHQPRDLSV